MNNLPELAMDRNELLLNLAKVVAADRALLLDGWQHLVLVVQDDDGSPDVTGFCYTDTGQAVPVAPKDFDIFDELQALREAMAAADGKAPWQAALFRISRASGQLNAEFEYQHPERWLVTPDNRAQRAREFAPA